MAKRRDEFMYGEPYEGRSVYGSYNNSVRPMTAEYALAWFGGLLKKPGLYRLVPVTVAEVKRQAARERRARKGKR